MGFWNKLGKIALTAAPYVAAPFTGGLSLAGTSLANKAVQKWSEKDAQKNLGKGLAPSKFDSVLGKVGGISSLASMFVPGGQFGAVGGLGKAGSVAGSVAKTANAVNKAQTASKLGGLAGALSNIGKGALKTADGGIPMNRTPDFNPSANGSSGGWQGALGEALGSAITRSGQQPSGRNTGRYDEQPDTAQNATSRVDPSQRVGGNLMPRGGFSYQNNPMNYEDQTTPNLAQALHQGRQEAIRNQPFRSGYETKTLGTDNETIYTSKAPPIYSGFGSNKKNRRQQVSQ